MLRGWSLLHQQLVPVFSWLPVFVYVSVGCACGCAHVSVETEFDTGCLLYLAFNLVLFFFNLFFYLLCIYVLPACVSA